MEPQLLEFLTSHGFDAADFDEPQIKIAERAFAVLQKYAGDFADDRAKDLALEQIVSDGLKANGTAADMELKLLREARRMPAMSTTPRMDGMPQADVPAASLAVSLSGGNSSRFKGVIASDVLDAATSKQHRGASLHSIMRGILWQHGENVPQGRFTDDAIRKVFKLSQRADDHALLAASPAVSTSSISGILSNVAGKIALASFNSVDTTWRAISKVVNLVDFKAAKSYRLDAMGGFKEVPPSGEIKHGRLAESEFSLQLSTYAMMLGLDRRDLHNDDLGMLDDMSSKFGRAAAVQIEKLFYTRFLNNSDFFKAANNNVSTGALTPANLDAAYRIFINQVDANGDPILLAPRVLLVPPSLIGTARSLTLRDSKVQGSSGSTSDGNPWAGMLEPMTSPYLENVNFTGYSAAAWYLLARPSDYATMQVGFLDGKETPTIETAELDFSLLGLAIRGYIDVGAAFQEPRGGVRSTGV